MIIVALPAYNEAASLPGLFHRFEDIDLPLRVVVVDDGSRDGTADVARAAAGPLDVEVVVHAHNRGLAGTVKTGLARALELAADDDMIVVMDADDTHSPDLFRPMWERVSAGCDIVVASRYVPGARIFGLSPARRIFSYVGNLLFRLVLPIPGIRDYTCGYRAFRAGFLRRVWAVHGESITTETGFAATAQLLLTCARFHPRAAEVPLTLHYERKQGASKMDVRATIIATLRLLWRKR
jgi:dolichol-phosphate mannosyltransferase